jgi:hypothetical protein
MKKTLDEVLAEAAIKDLQMRYCRGADRMDFELMRSCFHPDAKTEFFGETDVDGFIEMGREMLPAYVVTTHNTGNQLVEVSGETAWAEHYAVATHRIAADAEGPERDFVTAVRYVDQLECRDGDWRIARRKLVFDWARIDPIGDRRYDGASSNGRRDRNDPSYAR